MVRHPERDEEMIPSLLQFKQSLDTLLTQSFSSNDLFSQSLRESFEYFINRRRDKPAEYIAKYLDNLLRKGDKGLTTDATLEEEMDRVLILFRFVHGKDVFEAFYKKDLAKRLLLGKSASADAERSMLAKLKNGPSPLPLFSTSANLVQISPFTLPVPADLLRLSQLCLHLSSSNFFIFLNTPYSVLTFRMRRTIHPEVGGDVQRHRYLPGLHKIIQRPTTHYPPRTRSSRKCPLPIMVAHIPRQAGNTRSSDILHPRLSIRADKRSFCLRGWSRRWRVLRSFG